MGLEQPLKVYLCGPIAGCTLEQAGGWRGYAAKTLTDCGFTALDPLRDKYTKLPSGEPLKDTYSTILGAGRREIYEKDLFDVRRSDIILANFGEAEKVSIGSMFELAVARELRKFVVVSLRENDPFHDHPFVIESASVVTHDLDQALDQIISTFGYV